VASAFSGSFIEVQQERRDDLVAVGPEGPDRDGVAAVDLGGQGGVLHQQLGDLVPDQEGLVGGSDVLHTAG
jgi:hypothetical protein